MREQFIMVKVSIDLDNILLAIELLEKSRWAQMQSKAHDKSLCARYTDLIDYFRDKVNKF